MTAASLVAFGLVFLGASLSLSVLLAGPVLVLGERLRRLGPWVERRAAAAALLLPPLLALTIVAVLAADSAVALRAGTDHCLAHDHHRHLCLKHGAAWASQAWALALVLSTAIFLLVRSGLALGAQLAAQRSANRLRRLGTGVGAPGCFLVPARERFAFTAGLFSPAVLVSSAAWEALEPDERGAVLAHELCHLAHGDLWRRAALGLAALLGAPLLAPRLLGTWSLASERICDRLAAREVGRPSTVASAMLALSRGAPAAPGPAAAVFAAASHVPQRVVALLDEGPCGEKPSKHLLSALGLAAAFFGLACVAFAEPLHHLLETLLG